MQKYSVYNNIVYNDIDISMIIVPCLCSSHKMSFCCIFSSILHIYTHIWILYMLLVLVPTWNIYILYNSLMIFI